MRRLLASRTGLAASVIVTGYVLALSTSLRSQGVALGNVIAPPVAPLSTVIVPDVNMLGILDLQGTPGTTGANQWTRITNNLQRTRLQQLGKALFFDMQVGGDGVQACASCHYHAGADNRVVNQMSPGLKAGDTVHDLGASPHTNKALTAGDFLHTAATTNGTVANAGFPVDEGLLQADGAQPDAPDGSVTPGPAVKASDPTADVNDVASSQGVRLGTFTGLSTGRVDGNELATTDPAGFDHAFGTNAPGIPDTVRRVEPRNSPTVLNAVYNFRNFWDGRADAFFNGVNPLGFRDPGARVKTYVGGALVDERLRIPFSSLASQAVGPPLSSFEMHFDPRAFADLGRKMTRLSTVPLAGQDVSASDSLLGPLSAGEGLSVRYATLIRQVFDERFWGDGSGNDVCLDANGAFVETVTPPAECATYSLMQWNFALFFGLSVQAYEATLTTGQTIVDLVNGGVAFGTVTNGLPGNRRRTVNLGATAPAPGRANLSLEACVAALTRGLNARDQVAGTNACLLHFARFIPAGMATGTESSSATVPVANGTAIGGCTTLANCAEEIATMQNVSRGMGRFFAGATGCGICHFNPEFTGNTVSALTGFGAAPLEPLAPGQVRKIAPEVPLERMLAFNGLAAVYDSGFYNLGVRPSPEDISLGDSIGGVPLSFAKLSEILNGGDATGFDAGKLTSIAGELASGTVLRIPTSATNLAPRPWNLALACGPGLNGNGGNANNNPTPQCVPTVIAGERLLRNGAFHTQGLRNVKFTGPYLHNGSKMSLRQVVEFYKTAGHFPTLNLNNLDAGMRIFNLGVADEAALVEFMETGLTDWNVALERGKFDHPQICVPDGHDPVSGLTVLKDIPAVGSAGHAASTGGLVTFTNVLDGDSGVHDLQDACTMPIAGAGGVSTIEPNQP